VLLLGDAELGAHLGRLVRVLAADHHDLVGLRDAPAHALGPPVARPARLGVARDREGRRPAGLLHQPLVQVLIVLEVEADVDADVAHCGSEKVGITP
jgi:hypothetical protein